ncbi:MULTISPECIES: hypothetical protein [unclassified Streptomyces]|uniref:hypothetical protein n=1 Tax=unclassified Streptomyces TaxID=2593676 RepID=UPI00336ADC42
MRAPRTLKTLAVRAALAVGTALAVSTTLLVPATQAAAAPAAVARVAAGPTLISYDIQSKTLTGSGFLPSHRVWVRTAVSGSVPTCGTVTLSDLRTSPTLLQTTSDPSGNISVPVDPKATLPPLLVCPNPIVYLYGAYPGERVHFSAHDERYENGRLVWSNTLTVTA